MMKYAPVFTQIIGPEGEIGYIKTNYVVTVQEAEKGQLIILTMLGNTITSYESIESFMGKLVNE